MKKVLKIQPIKVSTGTVYYASEDGEVVLSLQGEITKKERTEFMEVTIPFPGDHDAQ